MDSQGRKIIVVDNGSGHSQAMYKGNMDLMVGEECSQLRQMLDISYPMDNGIVRNWEDMAHIWDHTFGPDKLDIDPKVGVVFMHELFSILFSIRSVFLHFMRNSVVGISLS
ncbi:hypothetical protein OESDEN_20528 [Oesophagostomum dentatum]|uniref:Actin n=1 Tax=Oesophagostomum dentatum TaxID=61180 RepID=A0A0B1S8E3_OESDE|nr:hypothetical protein OESDEN_20528 [Oesophagostomum dentatum]